MRPEHEATYTHAPAYDASEFNSPNISIAGHETGSSFLFKKSLV